LSNRLTGKIKRADKYISIIEYLILSVPNPKTYLNPAIYLLQPKDVGDLVNLCVPIKWGLKYLEPFITLIPSDNKAIALKITELILTCALSILEYISTVRKKLIHSFIGGVYNRVLSCLQICALIENENEAVTKSSFKLLAIFAEIFKCERYIACGKILKSFNLIPLLRFIQQEINLSIDEQNYLNLCQFVDIFLKCQYVNDICNTADVFNFINFFLHKYIYSPIVQIESVTFSTILKVARTAIFLKFYFISTLFVSNPLTDKWNCLEELGNNNYYTFNSLTIIASINYLLLEDPLFIKMVLPHIDCFISYFTLCVSVYFLGVQIYPNDFVTNLCSIISTLDKLSKQNISNKFLMDNIFLLTNFIIFVSRSNQNVQTQEDYNAIFATI
ncbi:LOW QUALITY PROTEIN: hypothetical protein MXB_4518, partial [Myxobolus squamalis]